ncbi:MAG: autotransporter domain-containing protein [Sphingomonas sp.]
MGGTLDLDIRVGGASDRIAATGAVALAGTVRPTIAAFTGGWAPVTILTGSSASVTNVALRDTLAVDYSVLASGANIVLDARFDFGLGTRNEAGLNPDEQALGGHLDASAQANATGLSALLTPLANLTVAADYKAALATLTPEAYAAQRWLGIRSTHQLEDAVLSCREGARGAAALRETSCAWLRGNDRSYTADTTAATAGYREDAQSLIGGVQFVLGDDWVIGAAGGYETADFVQQGRASGKVDRTLLAGTAKYMRGGFTGTLTLAASLGNMSMSRIVSGPVPGTAQGSGALDTYGARGRLAYGMAAGVFTIVPRVDFDLSRVRAGAVTETGAGAVALVLPAESETLLAATPAIEIGAAFDIGKVNVRPVLSAGATLYGKDRLSASAVLAGAPSGAAPFGAAAELEGAALRRSAAAWRSPDCSAPWCASNMRDASHAAWRSRAPR